MSTALAITKTVRFYEVQIGQQFVSPSGGVFTKTRKGGTEFDDGTPYNWNSQTLVDVIVDTPQDEPSWEILDRHTFEFTDKQRDDVIEKIIERAQDQYGADRINDNRLRKGLLCAHRTKPLRLIDLLNTCNVDFPAEILNGIYRHYNEETDSFRNGWTAQHSKPHVPDIFDFLFG